MLRDARGTGVQGVIARGDTLRFRATHITQHEDDWEQVGYFG